MLGMSRLRKRFDAQKMFLTHTNQNDTFSKYFNDYDWKQFRNLFKNPFGIREVNSPLISLLPGGDGDYTKFIKRADTSGMSEDELKMMEQLRSYSDGDIEVHIHKFFLSQRAMFEIKLKCLVGHCVLCLLCVCPLPYIVVQ